MKRPAEAGTHIVVLNELSTTSREHGTEHTLALTQAGIFPLLILDVDIEGFTLKEQLQVAVMLQDRMRSNLV